jgi:diguanylate cyclase (GGDEF)-like protein/putative nucleotidyltransferase with HDIG domain
MVDIDNLKIINDRHGHVVGNEVIQQVGFHLARALPMAHAICRYGGDEFFALVPMTKAEAAERAERLIVALDTLPADRFPCEVSVSIGVASHLEDGDLADTLMESADRAMYLAKGEGGNRVHTANAEDPEGQVFEAVIAVNARRLIPGETRAFRTVLDQLLRLEEQELDSTAVQQSLRALMEAVESKDSYTNTHSHEVSDLTLRMCQKIGLSHRETLAVEMGALVHDIGKIGIPDEILQKPGKLTTRERMRIEQHPEIGAQILRPLPALKDVVPLVLCHHEKWNGTGYPAGLQGEDIPIGAQLISLCDVWHALTSDRSYRPAFPDEKARSIIREGRGTDWKPELVDAFFEVLEELDAQEAQQKKSARPRTRRSA